MVGGWLIGQHGFFLCFFVVVFFVDKRRLQDIFYSSIHLAASVAECRTVRIEFIHFGESFWYIHFW